jgi:hypothetical protein
MTTPNIPRLQQLRRVVEQAPDDRFHMRTVVETADCGTARCAFGWALVDPQFQADLEFCHAVFADWPTAFPTTPAQPTSLQEVEYFPGNQVAKYFGLTDRQMTVLFGGDLSPSCPEHAVTKAEVIWNIDELIAGREPAYYKATGNYEGSSVWASGEVNENYDPDEED